MDNPELVDKLTILNPCPVPWDLMKGTESVRFCDQCELHVVDFEQMTTEEIVTHWSSHPNGVCAQMTRDSEGKLITRDSRTHSAFHASPFPVHSWARLAGGLLAYLGIAVGSAAAEDKRNEGRRTGGRVSAFTREVGKVKASEDGKKPNAKPQKGEKPAKGAEKQPNANKPSTAELPDDRVPLYTGKPDSATMPKDGAKPTTKRSSSSEPSKPLDKPSAASTPPGPTEPKDPAKLPTKKKKKS